MNLPRCGCGRYHYLGARWCVWCGAQPPRTKRRAQVINATSEAERAAFVAATVALGEALTCTGGKWGVA